MYSLFPKEVFLALPKLCHRCHRDLQPCQLITGSTGWGWDLTLLLLTWDVFWTPLLPEPLAKWTPLTLLSSKMDNCGGIWCQGIAWEPWLRLGVKPP